MDVPIRLSSETDDRVPSVVLDRSYGLPDHQVKNTLPRDTLKRRRRHFCIRYAVMLSKVNPKDVGVAFSITPSDGGLIWQRLGITVEQHGHTQLPAVRFRLRQTLH